MNFAFWLWLASAFCALAGTSYWIRLPRHAPNKDIELFGLTMLYVWWAALTEFYYAYYWCVKQLWESGLSK